MILIKNGCFTSISDLKNATKFQQANFDLGWLHCLVSDWCLSDVYFDTTENFTFLYEDTKIYLATNHGASTSCNTNK